MYPIIEEIFPENTLDPKQSSTIYSKLKPRSLSKGDLLLRPHQEVNELFYVKTGCLRSYIIDLEGKEHTLQFAVNSWWISDYIALYGRAKTHAVTHLECLKHAEVYGIFKTDFDQLCIDIPEVANFHKRKMELAFASFQNRILENLTLSAKQRYLNFVATYPTITNVVKNYHIASYLGITTESLSRIRKELSNS